MTLCASTALTMTLMLASPVAAQNSQEPAVITPPIGNFDITPKAGDTPRPTATAAPAPRPAPVASPTASPRAGQEAPVVRPTPTPNQRVAPQRPSATPTPTPVATPSDAVVATPTPVVSSNRFTPSAPRDSDALPKQADDVQGVQGDVADLIGGDIATTPVVPEAAPTPVLPPALAPIAPYLSPEMTRWIAAQPQWAVPAAGGGAALLLVLLAGLGLSRRRKRRAEREAEMEAEVAAARAEAAKVAPPTPSPPARPAATPPAAAPARPAPAPAPVPTQAAPVPPAPAPRAEPQISAPSMPAPSEQPKGLIQTRLRPLTPAAPPPPPQPVGPNAGDGSAPVAPVPPPPGALVTEIRPLRASIRDGMVTVDFEIYIQNRGRESADNVRAIVGLLTANAEQDAQIAAFHDSARMAPGSEPFSIAPGGIHMLTGQVTQPGDQLPAVEVQGRQMFVPILPVALKWYAGLSIRTLRDSFMIGTVPSAGGDRLGPLWIDRAEEGFGRLAAKRYVPKDAQ